MIDRLLWSHRALCGMSFAGGPQRIVSHNIDEDERDIAQRLARRARVRVDTIYSAVRTHAAARRRAG